jgi:DNA-binding IclR family transcriptional regulator
MKEDRQFVTALARGLAVLRCFTPSAQELGTTEIAALTGLPQPTVWRLCYTLTQLGYLVQGQSRDRMRVGNSVLALGYAAAISTDFAEHAYPSMRELAHQFDASLSLATREGANMMIIQRASSPSILQLNLHVGSTLPVLNSALGWAWLGGIGPHRRESVLTELQALDPAAFRQHRAAVARAQAQFDKNGYVLALGTYHPDVNAIAVPIVSADGERIAAINCGGASSSCLPKRLAGPVARALRDLAGKLAVRLDSPGSIRHGERGRSTY